MTSSPITAAHAHPHARPGPDSLLSHLARVPDPRARRGIRYRLSGLLAVTTGAVLAGARCFTAIGEWAHDLPDTDLAVLGLSRAPDESNLRKLCARLDVRALEKFLSAYAFTHTRDVQDRRVIAIDGKTLRGARAGAARAPHLIAALDHATGTVIGQDAVTEKSNEIPAVRDLISTFDPEELEEAVITVDAMHCQSGTAETITTAGADYVNQLEHDLSGTLARIRINTLRAALKLTLPRRADFIAGSNFEYCNFPRSYLCPFGTNGDYAPGLCSNNGQGATLYVTAQRFRANKVLELIHALG